MKKIVDKQQIINLYIDQNLSKEKTAKQLHIAVDTLTKYLKEYDISKSKELLSQARTLHTKKPFNDILNRINREEFVDLYLNQNKSYSFLMDYYNLSTWSIDKLIRYYDCHKSRSQSSSIVLENKYNKYGSKEAYEKHRYSNFLSNLEDKGLSKEDYYNNISQKCRKTWNSKSDDEIISLNEKRSETCKEKYGYAFSCMRPEARAHGNDSRPNREFANFLEKHNISFEREFAIDRKQYDFKIDNILIEINPTSTHNSTWGSHGDCCSLDKDYHYNKSKLARDNGYRCICIWDWDDQDKIINLLKPRDIIYARKCILKEVDLNTTREYLNRYHLQGYAKDTTRIGLFCNDELVSIMTFGKPRYNKNYDYELIRYCSSYNVVGGAEKLFVYFIRNYNPNSIISYCDWSKFNGDVYLKLGFSFKNYSIGKHWYNISEDIHITDNLLRQRGFDQLFNTSFGKGTSNEQLMLEHEFVEIYDCGQAVYEWVDMN